MIRSFENLVPDLRSQQLDDVLIHEVVHMLFQLCTRNTDLPP